MDKRPDEEKELRRSVGARLRAAREAKKLSLRDVAAELGDVTFQAVSHWENGLNPVSLYELHRLSRVYETSAAALVADRLGAKDLAAMVLLMTDEAKPDDEKTPPQEPSRKRHPRAA